MATYSIRDLEKLSGIKAHTLRIWEKRYNLLSPTRTPTNIRFYSDEDLKRILNVALLNRSGMRISKIAELEPGEISEKVNNISGISPNVPTIIESMTGAMIDLDEHKFDQILTSEIEREGFEKAVLHAFYPFFEKTGILWLTGSIIPAHEHFVSNLIRRRICVAIAGLPHQVKQGSKRFLLYLPEGEFHEISLMFYHFLVRKSGHQSVYLGQSQPFGDLPTIQKVRPSDFIVTTFSSRLNGINVEAYLNRLSSNFPDTRIFFSTYDGETIKELPGNVTRINNAEHLAEILRKI